MEADGDGQVGGERDGKVGMILHRFDKSLPFEPEVYRDDLVVLDAIRFRSLWYGPGAYRAHLEDTARHLEGVEISPFNPGAHTNDPEGYAYRTTEGRDSGVRSRVRRRRKLGDVGWRGRP